MPPGPLGGVVRRPRSLAHSKTTHISALPPGPLGGVPCPLAPWAGSSDILGPFNILKGFRDQICLNPSGMLCFPTFLYTKVSDSRQTPVLRGHYCVTSAMFFHTKLPDSGQTPVLRGHYCVKSATFFIRNCHTITARRPASRRELSPALSDGLTGRGGFPRRGWPRGGRPRGGRCPPPCRMA